MAYLCVFTLAEISPLGLITNILTIISLGFGIIVFNKKITIQNNIQAELKASVKYVDKEIKRVEKEMDLKLEIVREKDEEIKSMMENIYEEVKYISRNYKKEGK